MSVRIYGNRIIQTPPGVETRPTASKVREAVFNIWRARVPGARWLDLCTGSGAMGAEALARGAAEVQGIDLNGQACRVTHANWQKIARSGQTFSVLKGDVHHRLRQLKTVFDLIYFDPPYQAGLYVPILRKISTLKLLECNGCAAAEHDRNIVLPDSIASLIAVKRSHYGHTSLTFYQHQTLTPAT